MTEKEIEYLIEQRVEQRINEYKRRLIKSLIKNNPYPTDVFPEPTEEEWSGVGQLLDDNNKNSARIFAKFGRMIRKGILFEIKDF